MFNRYQKKFLGIPSPFEWYDLKVSFKHFIRNFLYFWFVRKIVVLLILGYMRLVYYTSKKEFINLENALNEVKKQQSLIILFWHNRLMMIPFFAKRVQQFYPKYQFMTLASRHGDGQFVGNVVEKFGFISILGSTQRGRKTSRGIGIDSIKKIISGLKEGYSLGITPDGPRGPNQKINGDVIHLAKISGAKILAISYSSSRFKELNSWDKFKIPLPFSKIKYICDYKLFSVDRSASKEDLEKIKLEVEKSLDEIQLQSSIFN